MNPALLGQTLRGQIKLLQNDLEAVRARGQAINSALTNRAAMNAAAITNVQGHTGGGGGIAAVAAVSRASGVFAWNVSATSADAAATNTVTWTVTLATGTGALAFTNLTQVTSNFLGTAVVNQAATGGIGLIASGAGTSLGITSEATVIGTAATGDKFAAGGLAFGATGGSTRFPLGNNVVILLSFQTSVSDAHVTSISMSLFELP